MRLAGGVALAVAMMTLSPRAVADGKVPAPRWFARVAPLDGSTGSLEYTVGTGETTVPIAGSVWSCTAMIGKPKVDGGVRTEEGSLICHSGSAFTLAQISCVAGTGAHVSSVVIGTLKRSPQDPGSAWIVLLGCEAPPAAHDTKPIDKNL